MNSNKSIRKIQVATFAGELQHFTGSEEFYRHALARRFRYTEGVKYLADQAGAYWLLDEIFLLGQSEANVRREEFQVWRLVVDEETGNAVLVCEDGNDNEVYQQLIPYTDFPLPEVTLWLVDKTLMLPSEY